MDHTEAIIKLDKIISEDFIYKIIPYIKHTAKDCMTIKNGIDKNERNVKGHEIFLDTPTKIFYWNLIKKEIEKHYYHYKIKFPFMQSKNLNQVDLLKYSVGGKYNLHVDSYTTLFRTLSVIINLNDEYEGGDLIFGNQKGKEIKRYKLQKGSIVFFPSNFLYPHGIEPIIKGTRYSIVAWLR